MNDRTEAHAVQSKQAESSWGKKYTPRPTAEELATNPAASRVAPQLLPTNADVAGPSDTGGAFKGEQVATFGQTPEVRTEKPTL